VLPEPPVAGAGVEVSVGDGAASEALDAGAGSTAVGEASVADEAEVTIVVGWVAAGDGTVTKTPPGAEAELAGTTAEAELDESPPEPEPPLEDPPPELPLEEPPVQLPASEPPLLPVSLLTTSGPGSGKRTSLPSTVVHPSPRFAWKIFGREEKATDSARLFLEEPPAMVTVAQFM